MALPAVSAINAANAATARAVYVDGLDRDGSRTDWHQALRDARGAIADALRASNYLADPASALASSGSHMTAFRHLLAPPLSQDQFKLLCPVWRKGTEKTGMPLRPDEIASIASTLESWLDPGVAPWLGERRRPRIREVRTALQRTAALIAAQQIQTVRRVRLAAGQESAVVDLLIGMGWTRRPSKALDTRAELIPKTFMHKTRLATRTAAPQEVDIACGLAGTYVAAIECKVTNDETNSVKRVNDILKKCESWKLHWGSFVETVAILQGVVNARDVDRLCDAGVVVFWSHHLGAFRDWISTRV